MTATLGLLLLAGVLFALAAQRFWKAQLGPEAIIATGFACLTLAVALLVRRGCL